MRFQQRLRAFGALTLGFVFLHGCRDITGPGAGVRIALRADVGVPRLDTATNAPSRISCSVQLTAAPSGSGGASWLGGTVEFFAGRDRTTSVQTEQLTSADVSQLFNSAPITAGTNLVTSFDVFASVPFSARLTLRYHSDKGGADRATSADIGCGAVPAGAAPTISSLTVTPSTGLLDVGDSLSVSYNVSSSAGVWHESLRVPLPCGDFTEEFNSGGRATVARTVYVRIPSICPLGQHVTSAQLTATDAGLLTATKSASFDLTLADTRPPKISLDSLGGDFFVGDTIHWDWWVTDNGTLRKLGWQIPGAGIGDSLDARSAIGSLRVSVPLRAEWAPAFQLQLFAEDGVGNRSTITSAPNGMRLHPTVVRTITSLPLGAEYGEYAIDESRQLLYMLGAYQPTLAIVSLSSLQIIGSLALPQIGTSIDITPSGDTLLVTLNQSRSLAVIDLTKADRPIALRDISILNAAAVEQPLIVRTIANGHALINTVSADYQPVAPFIDLDLATWTTRRLDFTGTNMPTVIADRSGDRRVFVLRNGLIGAPMTFTRYDAITGQLGASHTISSPPIGALSVDYTGQHVAISYDVYDASFNRISHSPQLTGEFTIVTPDGSTLWQSGIVAPFVRTRVTDGAVLDRSPGTNLGRTRFLSDGSKLVTLYVNTLTLVDAR